MVIKRINNSINTKHNITQEIQYENKKIINQNGKENTKNIKND